MNTPARLHKRPEEPKSIIWINNHAYLIVPVCLVVGFILLILLTYSIGCCVESGMLRNFLAGGI